MGLMSLIGTNLPIRNVRFHGESWRVSGRATEIAKATSCQRCQGVIHATRAVMGSMRARRYGRIVNLTSIAAIGNALPGNAFYAATKAKVVILQHGITANAVASGFVRTGMTQRGPRRS
jgi:NAD(P)-dependent dehydrogenase (short-subunit alcohol dehydrogenase family)